MATYNDKKKPLTKVRFSAQDNMADIEEQARGLGRANNTKLILPDPEKSKAPARSGTTATSRPGVGQRVRDYIGKNEGKISDVVPYMTNVAGLFRNAPMPKSPTFDQNVSLSPIRMGNAYRKIDSEARASERALSQGLTGQAAAAARASQIGSKFDAYSNVAANETAANQQQQQALMQTNAAINSRNTDRWNNYGDQLTERNIAQQRDRSENLANFADKVIQQGARRDQMALDKEKYQILSRMYTPGLMNRVAQGITMPGSDDEKITDKPVATAPTTKPKGFRNGGKLKPVFRR